MIARCIMIDIKIKIKNFIHKNFEHFCWGEDIYFVYFKNNDNPLYIDFNGDQYGYVLEGNKVSLRGSLSADLLLAMNTYISFNK